MKQMLTGKQMKQADTWSIKEFGMESLILMERAALCAAQHIMSVQKPGCVFIMCGMGNNGADGLAMARILSQNGWSVRIAAIGQIEKATKEWLYQKALLDKMEICAGAGVCGCSIWRWLVAQGEWSLPRCY